MASALIFSAQKGHFFKGFLFMPFILFLELVLSGSDLPQKGHFSIEVLLSKNDFGNK